MGRLALKNVTERAGLLYFRRKVAGRDVYTRLPAIDSPEFADEYARLSTPDVQRPRAPSGSIAALVNEFRRSAEFLSNSLTTRTNQGRYLDMVVTEHGHRTVKGVRPVHVYRMRDAMAVTPGKANNWLSVFSSLMDLAVRLDLRGDNPTSTVPLLPIGEHEPWPADLLSVALETATPMTRFAIVTGLCLGQRISDAIRMQHGWHDRQIMQFQQHKRVKQPGGGRAGKHVAVPLHPFWLAEYDAIERRAVTLLYDRSGRPFGGTDAIQERLRKLMASEPVRQVLNDLEAREVIPLGSTFTFHGLRKNACCYLLELGLGDAEVGSVLGMSAEMVRHYGKRARALVIARGAAERITGGKILHFAGANAKPALIKNG